MEAYDGPQIVGMDLHRRRPVLVRMTEDGRKLSTARTTSSPVRLAAEIKRAGPHPRGVRAAVMTRRRLAARSAEHAAGTDQHAVRAASRGGAQPLEQLPRRAGARAGPADDRGEGPIIHRLPPTALLRAGFRTPRLLWK